MFTTKDVAELRKITGAGIMDCKNALKENDGNVNKAKNYLREKGIAKAAKKSSRIAAEGMVGYYQHMGGKIGVLVEVNSETDFVAKNEKFQSLVKDIAMHIAASNPICVNTYDLDQKLIDEEKNIFKSQALNEGKDTSIIDNMVDGRIKKYIKEVVLLEQAFVKDPSKTVKQLIDEATYTIGEKISVRRFARYELGEGLEKKDEDFATEVMGQSNK